MPTLVNIIFDSPPAVYQVNKKMVISGQHIEIYEYEKSYYKGFPRLFNPKKYERTRIVKKKQEEVRIDNVRRARQKIRRLINANEKDFTKIMTLTFSEHITDLNIANKKLDIFFKKLKRLFPNLKYVAVPEFQGAYNFKTGLKKEGGGAIHYHILTNIVPYISNDDLAKLWGNGWAWLRYTYKIDNLGAYLSKYLTKEISDSRYFRKKKFFYSLNLLRPIIIDFLPNFNRFLSFLTGWLKSQSVNCYIKFSSEFLTDFLGVLKYTQIVLKVG